MIATARNAEITTARIAERDVVLASADAGLRQRLCENLPDDID